MFNSYVMFVFVIPKVFVYLKEHDKKCMMPDMRNKIYFNVDVVLFCNECLK